MKKYGKKVQEALRGEFVESKQRVQLTSGQAIRIYREAQNLSQAELAKQAGLTQSTISGLESNRLTLGVERAERIARALKVHPGLLAFPGWSKAAA